MTGPPSNFDNRSLDSLSRFHTQDMVVSSQFSSPSKDPSSNRHSQITSYRGNHEFRHRSDPLEYVQGERSTYPQQQSAAPYAQHQIWFPTADIDMTVDYSNARQVKSADPHQSPSFPPQPIEFYDKNGPFYGFTNFSPHPVYYHGKEYPTSEHLFQSFKFVHKPNLAEHIRTCDRRPSKAFSEARRFQAEVRPDWKYASLRAMDVALWHKFNQHPDLKAQLLNTGTADLVEKSDVDDFWGVGKDGNGRNELGKALERLRDQLRTVPSSPPFLS